MIELTPRQLEIVNLVHARAPITGEQLAETLGVSRPTLRADLALLVMLGLLDAKPRVGYFPGSSGPAGGPLSSLQALKVRDVQAVPVSVAETQSVRDAVVTLFTENVSTLLVVDSGKALVGIVTPKDLLKVTLGNPNADSMPVSMVMTRQPNIVAVGQDDLVVDAIRKMTACELDCLPVVREAADGVREASGWITKTQVVALLGEMLSAVNRGGTAEL